MKLILFASFLCLAFASKLPANLPLCHKSDPEFEKCFAENLGIGLKVFGNGDRGFGLPKIDPLFIEQLHIQGSGNPTSSLQQNYDNVYIDGMTDTVAHNLKFERDRCSWSFDAFTEGSIMIADYELKGQILIFPINGKGKCKVSLTNINAHHEVTCERIVKDGKTYMNLTDWKMSFMPKKVVFDFENLIPGNKQLSDQILTSMNENSLEIFKEVIPAFQESYGYIHLQYAKKIFDKLPENEIFLD